MKLFDVIKEINNYFFLRKTIKKNRDTPEWKKHNLKDGYFGIIYTLVNLPPEVFEGEEQYYQMYVIEQIKPINEYLAFLNLQEIVSVRVENKCDKEQGIYAFGVIYSPFFREFSFGWLFKWTAILGITSWLFLKFDLIVQILKFCTWIYSMIP